MFSVKLEKSILLRRIAIWKRKQKLNRILIGKPEFKHTNDKVIITLYVYNRELLILNSKMKSLKQKILVEYFSKLLVKNKLIFAKINLIKNILVKIDILKRKLKSISKRYIFKKGVFLNLKINLNLLNKTWSRYKDIKNNGKKNIFLAKSLKYLENKFKYYEKKNLFIFNENTIAEYYIYNINNTDNNGINSEIIRATNISPKFELSRLLYIDILKKLIIRIRLYLRYHRIIFFNKSKFNIFIRPLKKYLEKIYKKEVEFNIVNLKSYHLDSNILTQIMAIKLAKKKSKLAKIMRIVLSKVKLPLSRKLQYHKVIPRSRYLQNLLIKQLINNNTYNMIPGMALESINKKSDLQVKQVNLIESKNDKLDMILKVLYPRDYILYSSYIKDNTSFIKKRNLIYTTLDLLKNKIISGMRIEVSGRLSKRVGAAKAVYKMKQKGTIRNIDSSYKKISSVVLRGNFKSNVQLSKANGKTRIGAFGVKGWIGSI